MKIANDTALNGDSVPETLGRAKAGEHRIISRDQKKVAFHDRLKALRKIPGNCSRCGQRNESSWRTCDACRVWMTKRRHTEKSKPCIVERPAWDALMGRVASLEHEIARMVVDHRARYREGYRAGQRHERKARFASLPYLSRQEAAQINHAYRAT